MKANLREPTTRKPYATNAARSKSTQQITAARRKHDSIDPEGLYQRVFDCLSYGLMVLNARTGTIDAVNQHLSGMLGYTHGELVGKIFWEISAFSGIAPNREAFKALQADEWTEIENLPLKTKSGSLVKVDFIGKAYQAGHRRVMQCEFRELTEDTQRLKPAPRSEAALRALFAAMQDVVFVVDRLGVYREIAPTQPGLLYQPPQELLGKNLQDLFPSEQASQFIRTIQQVVDSGQSARVEYELPIAGRMTTFATSISRMDEERTLWVARDMTEAKEAEQALRSAHAEYHSLFENSPVGIYQSTPQGCFIKVNPAMAQIFGYGSPEELVGEVTNIAAQSYMEPTARNEFQRLVQESGQVHEFTSQARRRDGVIIWVRENARVVRAADGSVLYYEGFMTDITGRQHAEEERGRLASIVDSSEDAITGTSMDGLVTSWNSGAEKMYGYSRAEAIGQPISFIVPTDRLGELEATFGLLKAGQSVEHAETVRVTKDGKRLDVSISLSPILDAAGKLVSAAGIARNITERKRAQDELQKAKDTLETINRELQLSLLREETLARTDGLTGLCNRVFFDELATREFHAAKRYGRPLSIMMMDIDNFKNINDNLGHAAGDEALTLMANIAAGHIRSTDVLARFGGDEFILLLPETDAQHALIMAERLRTKIAAIPIAASHEGATVTLSIGISELRPAQMESSVEQVIHRADRALYRAKAEGRNRVVILAQDEI